VALFRRLICTDYKNQPKKLAMVVYLVTNLTCMQGEGCFSLHYHFFNLKHNISVASVFDVNELLMDLVIDLLERVKDSQNLNILLDILLKVLPQPEDENVIRWDIVWKFPGGFTFT
jgi:hypothetical protein